MRCFNLIFAICVTVSLFGCSDGFLSYPHDPRPHNIAVFILPSLAVFLLFLSVGLGKSLARSLVRCALAGVVTGFVCWEVAFTYFHIFDSLRYIVFGFLPGFFVALLFVSLKPTRKFFSDRKQEAANTLEWNAKRVNENERQAKEAMVKVLAEATPPPRPPRQNAEIQLKWARKAREKASLDFADDPIALGEALDRIDDEIKTLEQQVESSKVPEMDHLTLLDRAIEHYPTNASLYLQRGIHIITTLKDSKRALADVKQSILYLPCYAEAHEALGIIYFDRKQYGNAAWHFREAIRLDPELSKSREMLEVIRRKQQRMWWPFWIDKLLVKRRED